MLAPSIMSRIFSKYYNIEEQCYSKKIDKNTIDYNNIVNLR